MRRWLRALAGSVTVDITGADVERLLTGAVRQGAVLDEVRRVSGDTVAVTAGLESYFILRRLSRRAMCRLRVGKKRGLPFRARRLGRRWGLLLGLALAAGAAWYLSGFVWTIGVEGCRSMGQREALELLQKAGLETGSRLSRIDGGDIRNRVLLMTDRLSFVAVNLRGTHAQVILREREVLAPSLPVDTPCDVISDKAGMVAALRVREGTARVKVGDTVLPGDLLVSGLVTQKLGETRRVHASAEVDLRTWHTFRRLMPKQAQGARETGERVVRRALVIGNWRIGLNLIENAPFACYDKKIEKFTLTLAEDFRYPIAWVTETYVELAPEPAQIDGALAARLLEQRLRESLAMAYPEAEVAALGFEMRERGGAFEGILRAECLETTGVQRATK